MAANNEGLTHQYELSEMVDFRTVLITGGAGFIGTALTRELLRRGLSVTTIDTAKSPESITYGVSPAVFRSVTGDVRDSALVDKEVAAADLVVHLAAIVGVDNYISHPRDVLDVNILGTKNVTDACLRYGRPVLIASTSEVYGRNFLTLREDAHKIYGDLSNIRWSYAVSKATGELYAHSRARAGLVYCIVRYFNVYGPGLDHPGEGRVVSKFIGCIRDRKPLPLVGGGTAVRSFCYIDDAIEATLKLALDFGPVSPIRSKAVNIGRHEPVTIRHLAERMICLSGHRNGTVEIKGTEFFGQGFEEIPSRIPDLALLRDLTGFTAGISLEEGLGRTLDSYGLSNVDCGKFEPSPQHIPFVEVRIEPDDQLVEGIITALRTGRLTNGGPNVRLFEEEAARWLGVTQTVAVSSGATALLLSAQALELNGGVAVLPSFTFIATLNAVVHAGFKPVFCDIDPETYTMDPGDLESIVESIPDVRLVVPVNVFGVPPDLEALAHLASRAGAAVLLDAAHGFGIETDRRRSAAHARISTYSLHATKVLVAGEGGLIVSEDALLLDRLRTLRNHGLAGDVLDSRPGYNAKMTEIEALISLHSLRRLDGSLYRRRLAFNRLRKFILESCEGMFTVQRIPEGVRSNAQNLAVRCLRNVSGGVEGVIDALRKEGVEGRRYFWPPLHQMRILTGGRPLPRTDEVVDSLFCLPIHERMQVEVLERIENALLNIVRQ
jgi:dTDP-4-amino-4,6-dideoxygalactose transaminase/nucleoside-diphosphate-sugar epimerase